MERYPNVKATDTLNNLLGHGAIRLVTREIPVQQDEPEIGNTDDEQGPDGEQGLGDDTEDGS